MDEVEQYFFTIVDDIAKTLAHIKYQRTGCEHRFIN